LHDELVDELKSLMPGGNYSTQCLFQPIPTLFSKHSVENGGNMLGLDKVNQNALLWLITGASESLWQQSIMQNKLATFSATLEKFAETSGLHVDWQYLNYVDKSQNPLRSYGSENMNFVRKVAAKYDPSGMFQKKVVSGWKISKA
jgi:hypothetical protein